MIVLRGARSDTPNPGFLPIVSLWIAVCLAACGCGGGDTDGPLDGRPIPLPAPDRVLSMAGLHDTVHVFLDGYGIPHIYGSREEDVLLAQGYLHARNRFTQIDLLRHVGGGRVSEITGEMPGVGPLVGQIAAVSIDWLVRSLTTTPRGARIADEIIDRASPELLMTMDSFAAGVNAYIRELREGRAQLEPYYKQLFGVTEERVPDYTREDLVNLGLFLTFFLGGVRDVIGDMTQAAYVQSLDPDILHDTLRNAPADPITVLPYPWEEAGQAGPGPGTQVAAGKEGRRGAEVAVPAGILFPALDRLRLLFSLVGDPDQRRAFGSNNWVVHADHTRRGHALMANDQHLVLFNPPIYYHAHLDTRRFGGGDLGVIGVSFAGFPGVTSGHNGRVAWGQTVMGYDQADIYLETVLAERDGFPERVLFQGEAVPTERVTEAFRIGQGPEATTVTLPIVYTRQHGPILPYSTRNGRALSVKWVGQEPFRDSEGLYLLERVRDVFETAEVLENLEVAAFHWVFADVQGNIGYSGHARIPVRQNARAYPPYLPLPGTGEAEWTGYVPEEALPLGFNPEEGFFNTSNNDALGTTLDNDPVNDPYYYHRSADLGFRARRIRRLLADRVAAGDVVFEDNPVWQADTYSMAAERLLPFLFDAAQARPEQVTPRMEEALGRLEAWGRTSPTGVEAFYRAVPPSPEEMEESVGSCIFHAWMNRLLTDTFEDDFLASGVELPGAETLTKAILFLLERPDEARTGGALFDDRTTPDVEEDAAGLMLRSLQDALETLERILGTADMEAWRWGKVHQTTLQLGYEGVALPLFPVQGPFPKSGARFTVDASDFGTSPDRFANSSGANTRFVIEMEPGAVRGVNAQPGGQSESPEDPHYGDLTALWFDNRTHELYFRFDDVVTHREAYWRLDPQ